jgi:hypothetical protein
MKIILFICLVIVYNFSMLPMFSVPWYVYLLNLCWILPVTIEISRRIRVRGKFPKKNP